MAASHTTHTRDADAALIAAAAAFRQALVRFEYLAEVIGELEAGSACATRKAELERAADDRHAAMRRLARKIIATPAWSRAGRVAKAEALRAHLERFGVPGDSLEADWGLSLACDQLRATTPPSYVRPCLALLFASATAAMAGMRAASRRVRHAWAGHSHPPLPAENGAARRPAHRHAAVRKRVVEDGVAIGETP